jgi:hypothetical protein
VQNTVSALAVLTVVGTVSVALASAAQLQQPAAAAAVAAVSVQLQLHPSATATAGDVSDAVSVTAAVPYAAVDLSVSAELQKEQMDTSLSMWSSHISHIDSFLELMFSYCRYNECCCC